MKNRQVFWLSAVLSGLYACGPRISVGDLGNGGAPGAAGSNAMAGADNKAGGPSTTPGTGGSGPIGGSSAQGGKAATGGTDAGGTPVDSAEGGEKSNTGGSDGASGGSSPGEGCPKTLSEFLPAIAASNCPDSVPALDEPCTVSENAVCAWQDSELQSSEPGYTAFGCYASLTGKSWYGGGQGVLGDFGADTANCPRQTPEAGASCSGHAGENCYYPLQFCSCAADAGNWTCSENPKPYPLPRPAQRLCVPAGLDESKAIKDLTDGEVTTWCNWFADPSGRPRPKVIKLDPPNVAQSYSSTYEAFGAAACLLDLPLELCQKNLRLRPDCDATLEQLDDCVETLHAAGSAVVGHGCAPLLANTKCQNVIAQKWDPRQQTPGCATPLE